MHWEKNVADRETFAVDSRWGGRGHSAGRGQGAWAGVAEPFWEGCVKWRKLASQDPVAGWMQSKGQGRGRESGLFWDEHL